MRICITRSEKYAYSETFIRDQINEFSKLSDICTIHSGRYPERSEDGKLLSPKLFWLIHKLIKTITGRNNLFSDYGVKRYLKKNKVDVVLANYGMSASHMVPPCKALNIPLLVIFHGHDATDKKILHSYKNKYTKLFKYASSIIVVSNAMKKHLINYGANENKIQVIPCGVSTLKFIPNSTSNISKKLLAVGRFTSKKGPLYTIKAFAEVLQKHPDATLTMVGKKTGLYDDCMQLITELNISKSINFTGILKQSEISELMKDSLAFMQHSVTAPNGDMEGTPVSIMEAAATGLPIVSTKHGGINDVVIHNKTGYLVNETNHKEMANYVIQLCDNLDLAKELGLNGRAHIEENYEQSKQIKKIHQLAEQAIK